MLSNRALEAVTNYKTIIPAVKVSSFSVSLRTGTKISFPFEAVCFSTSTLTVIFQNLEFLCFGILVWISNYNAGVIINVFNNNTIHSDFGGHRLNNVAVPAVWLHFFNDFIVAIWRLMAHGRMADCELDLENRLQFSCSHQLCLLCIIIEPGIRLRVSFIHMSVVDSFFQNFNIFTIKFLLKEFW